MRWLSMGMLCLALAGQAQETWEFENDERTGIRFSADGFLGPETGEWREPFQVDANGILRVQVPEEDGSRADLEFTVGAGRDLMIRAPGNPSESRLEVLVRKPATLTRAELAGTWRVLTFEARERDAGAFLHGFEDASEAITLAANGTFTVGDTRGTWNVTATRELTVTVGGGTLGFSVNASKDLMFSSTAEEGGQYLMRVLVRPPTTSQPASHLAG